MKKLNYYELLEVDYRASLKKIKSSYLKVLLNLKISEIDYHEKLKNLNEAFFTLTNLDNRLKYDINIGILNSLDNFYDIYNKYLKLLTIDMDEFEQNIFNVTIEDYAHEYLSNYSLMLEDKHLVNLMIFNQNIFLSIVKLIQVKKKSYKLS